MQPRRGEDSGTSLLRDVARIANETHDIGRDFWAYGVCLEFAFDSSDPVIILSIDSLVFLQADNTISTLLSQREQLQGASDAMQDTRNLTKEAHRKITELQRRIMMEKVSVCALFKHAVTLSKLIIAAFRRSFFLLSLLSSSLSTYCSYIVYLQTMESCFDGGHVRRNVMTARGLGVVLSTF